MTRRNHSKAFTLVELLVTVSVLGILAGLSVASFSRSWQNERVKAAARESTAWLEEVRTIAIQKAKPCRVQVTPADTRLALAADPSNPNQYCAETDKAALDLRAAVPNTSDLLLCAVDLAGVDPAGYELACTTSQTGSNNLIFTPRGTVTNGILLKLAMGETNTDRCIAVMAPLGQIRSGPATEKGCDFKTAY